MTNVGLATTITLSKSLHSVLYNLHEDPKLLQSGEVPERGPFLVALAPDARVVAVAVNTSIFLFATSSRELMETLSNVHGGMCLSVCVSHSEENS